MENIIKVVITKENQQDNFIYLSEEEFKKFEIEAKENDIKYYSMPCIDRE